MKIAFTSCMDADDHDSQPVWTRMAQQAPDVLMLLGDQIYMDWDPTALFDESPERRRLDRKPEKYLPRFVQEMHDRYAMQWEVPEFQAFIRGFVAEHGPDRVLVTWDDHDFAWNNGCGGGDPGKPRYAKPEVVEWSRKLFNQFVQVLRQPPPEGAPYPSLASATNPQSALPLATDLGGFPIVLLDQRSWRTHLDDANATLMGQSQQAFLWDQVARGQGLLIVAGGSPMRRDQGRREQGWRSKPDDQGVRLAYPEYAQFIARAQQAERAVLYLAGDIHHNAYGGPVEPQANIVQVLASGAARGGSSSGNFGLITLEGATTPLAGTAKVELFHKNDAPQTIELRIKQGLWDAPPTGTFGSEAPQQEFPG
ncbi:MAG: hypothetical protein EOP38_16195 [Rubrivivax sp.]|nr:MAG: hypothetical protein EOP38_16195 [Rubrivivax sp.]